MFQNNNDVIAKRLSLKCLQASSNRNMIAVIAILLTTILFTTVFTVGHGAIYSGEQQMLRQVGTKFDTGYKFLTEEQFLKIKSHPSFQNIGERQYLALAENDELIKQWVEIDYGNEPEAEGKYSVPTTGRMPESIEEAAVDTVVLDLLGIPHEIGVEIPLVFSINGEQRQRKVTLCGYWDGEANDDLCYLWVSKDFINRELAGIPLPENGYSGAGNYFLDVDFSNHRNLQEQINKALIDSGYDPDAVLGDSLYVATDVNPVYISSKDNGIDIKMILAVSGLLVLILISGYLIIYNIFQISVVKDIRLYGQLKTLGTSPKQLRIIVRRQGLILSVIGIPIGLLIGHFLGRLLVPVIMNVSNYEGIIPPPNAFVFIGAAIFALLTVLISFRKPAKTAATISTIEAMRYSGVETGKRKQKKSKGGSKTFRMAASNLIRNPRKTFVVLLSISLSTVLINSVLTFTDSFQLQKFIDRDVISDFVVSDAQYGRGNPFGRVSGISKSVIHAIQQQSTFKDGGSVYYHQSDIETDKIDELVEHTLTHITSYNGMKTEEGKSDWWMQFYGMDKFPFSLLDVSEGDLDWEKFNTGKYAIEFSLYNDYHRVDAEDYKFNPGDKIVLEIDGVKREYEVLARAACKRGMDSGVVLGYSSTTSSTFLTVSSSEFLNNFPSQPPRHYLFNVGESADFMKMNSFLQDYTEQIEPGLKYTSKQTVEDNFYESKQTYNIAGMVLAAIFAVIGLLNFINVIATGILSRQKEFAVMRSIGMTKRQLRKMLMLEGLWYAIIAAILSFIFSTIFSLLLVRPITDSIWFCTFTFTLTPVIIVLPFYLLVGTLVPLLAAMKNNRVNVVEQLRQAE
ncbi:MAG: ABC transporter permease [Lachnospiraceae bacterium]|nr:ABC transporter permease [Lachnospiraceae bacterium]